MNAGLESHLQPFIAAGLVSPAKRSEGALREKYFICAHLCGSVVNQCMLGWRAISSPILLLDLSVQQSGVKGLCVKNILSVPICVDLW
jgi:hypothetical protein